jgi:iron complex outermembrane receptor protein
MDVIATNAEAVSKFGKLGAPAIVGAGTVLAVLGLASAASAQVQDGAQPAQPASVQANGAAATPGANTPSSGIADIIVTAQKRSENLQKVPITITAVNNAQISSSGIVNTDDLPRLASGLATSRGLGAGSFFFPFIRGVGSSITTTGLEASVATYIDGVYQPDTLANLLDLEGIQQIEILKGPQGTLFGRNATGGAISIITNAPSQTFAARGSVSYGRFGETVERGYINVPLSSDLAANVSVVSRQGGSYIHNIATDQEYGSTRGTSLNAKIKWTPGTRFSATAGFIYIHRRNSDISSNLIPIKGTVPAGTLVGGETSYGPYTSNLNRTPLTGTNGYEGLLNLRYSLDFAEIVSISSVQHYKDFIGEDYDITTAKLFGFDNQAFTNAKTEELQLVSTAPGPFKWVVGGYYIHERQGYVPLTAAYAGPGGTDVDFNSRSGLEGEAAFAQGTYSLSPSTRFTGGIRYSHERKTLTGTETLPQLGLLIGGPIDLAKSFSKATWRFSIDHDFSPNILGFLSYNRGFKSGGFNSSVIANQKALSPEVLDAIEAGLKTKLFDNRLQLNLSTYYYFWKDIQVQRVGDDGSTILQSAGGAHLYGLDVEAVYRPASNFEFHFGANFEHSEYTRFDDASGIIAGPGGSTQAVVFPSLKGHRVLNAPDITLNASLVYTLDLHSSGSIDFSPNVNYSSKYEQIPGLGVSYAAAYVNGTITWNLPGDRFTIGVYGKNLTDRHSAGAYPTALYVSEQVIRPTTYGVTVGFKL